MIGPKMATLLCVLMTDYPLSDSGNSRQKFTQEGLNLQVESRVDCKADKTLSTERFLPSYSAPPQRRF